MDIISKINKLFKEDIVKMNNLIKSITKNHEELIDQVSTYLISSGGKQLRPILTIICSKLCNYKGQRHINLAAAVEFIHTATLLHDDVVDNSSLRRGVATANNLWGNKTSILVGDFLLAQAFILMVEDKSLKVLKILSSASAIIAEGEVMQLNIANNISLTYENYIKIVEYKTAELFAAACQIGSLITNMSENYEIALRGFGMNLGIAFQIIDDYLDYFAKDKSSGKNIGNDFYENKVTLPVILVYSKSNNSEKKFINESFSSLHKDETALSKLIELLNKYQVNEIMHNYASDYLNKAKDHLKVFENNSSQEILFEILDFCLKRVY